MKKWDKNSIKYILKSQKIDIVYCIIMESRSNRILLNTCKFLPDYTVPQSRRSILQIILHYAAEDKMYFALLKPKHRTGSHPIWILQKHHTKTSTAGLTNVKTATIISYYFPFSIHLWNVPRLEMAPCPEFRELL